jgi:aromatic ring hydroxylase
LTCYVLYERIGDIAVWINGERVKDVTAHPMFRPLVDVRAAPQ